MAFVTLPLLYLNLGGEMIYILDQRLHAQKIARDKCIKVLSDICGLMLNKRLSAELFVPQPLGTATALRSLFRDLAHASIMRLDDASMSKMWDLMTMAVKHQALRATSPLDLVFVTLNHLDSIRNLVGGTAIHRLVDHAHTQIVKRYASMPSGELQAVRYHLLNFLQGLCVRVSIFLKQEIQHMDGSFCLPTCGPVPYGCEVPGTLRIFSGDGLEREGILRIVSFPPGGDFTPATGRGSLDIIGERGTTLGLDVYGSGPSDNIQIDGAKQQGADGSLDSREGLHVGREELNMLMAQLLGNRHIAAHPGGAGAAEEAQAQLIKLSLFNRSDSDQTRSDASISSSEVAVDSAVLSIDATGSAGSRSAGLRKVMADLEQEDIECNSPERKEGLLDLLEGLES